MRDAVQIQRRNKLDTNHKLWYSLSIYQSVVSSQFLFLFPLSHKKELKVLFLFHFQLIGSLDVQRLTEAKVKKRRFPKRKTFTVCVEQSGQSLDIFSPFCSETVTTNPQVCAENVQNEKKCSSAVFWGGTTGI